MPGPGRYGSPKRSHAGLALGLSGGGLVLVTLITIGIVGITNHRQHVADVSYSAPSSSRETSSPTTAATTTETTSRESTTSGTTERRTAESSASETSQSAPTEEAGPHPVYRLETNPLFTTSPKTFGLVNRDCALSRWGSSPQAKERFFESGIACLNAVWQPVLEQAGLPFDAPSLSVPLHGGGSSPCSTSGESFAAYYCGGNETIYMPLDNLQIDQYGAHPGVYLAVLAHEYGHHVQHLSGIMRASVQEQQQAGGSRTSGALIVSRRLELEAQCFSGVFVGSARGDVNQTIQNEGYQSQDRGDHNGGPRTHGTDAHSIGWWRLGYKTDRIAQCNTWAASAQDVA